ncbi:MAG: lysylphosphatidylglycerol synthase domain-containing protein [Bacteroidota bacterium]
MTLKKRNNIITLVKLVIALFSFGFLFYKLKQSNDFSFLNALKFAVSNNNFIFFLFVSLLLVVVNWTLEAVKWKFILLKIENLSIFEALKSTFSGVAIGFVTPNRIGEFAGKILFLKEENRVNATYLNSITSAAQLFITLVLGLVSSLFFKQDLLNYFSEAFVNIVQLLSLLGVVLVISFLFYNEAFFEKLSSLKIIQSLNINYTKHEIITHKVVLVILLYSLLRYLTFVVQYYLLFYVFNLTCDFSLFSILTAFYFLLITAIPTFFITEVGVRGSAALFVYSFVFPNAEFVLSAAFSVWFLNLAIPAVIGVFFVLKNKTNTDD